MRVTRTLVGSFVLAAALSCGDAEGDQRTDSLDPEEAMQARENMPAELVAQLDSGTLAFRANDVEAALAHYTRATEIAPDVGAGWFGVYMAQDALGNREAAAEALERAQSLVPGTTMIHDGSEGAT